MAEASARDSAAEIPVTSHGEASDSQEEHENGGPLPTGEAVDDDTEWAGRRLFPFVNGAKI